MYDLGGRGRARDGRLRSSSLLLRGGVGLWRTTVVSDSQEEHRDQNRSKREDNFFVHVDCPFEEIYRAHNCRKRDDNSFVHVDCPFCDTRLKLMHGERSLRAIPPVARLAPAAVWKETW